MTVLKRPGELYYLFLQRSSKTDKCTTGTLHVMSFDDNEILFTCKTVEPPWKDNHRNISCIPEGQYEMLLEYSPRFKRMLWELKDVKGRTEVKIHTANHSRQLNGCIAPGLYHEDIDGDGVIDVAQSSSALSAIHHLLEPQKSALIVIDV